MKKAAFDRMRLAMTLLLVFLPTAMHAQEVPKDYNAETMLNLCQGKAEGAKELQSMICTFRIQGVSSLMIENCRSISRGFSPVPTLASERPPSRGAAKQAFINFMKANPEEWTLPWGTALALALSKTFPCKNLR